MLACGSTLLSSPVVREEFAYRRADVLKRFIRRSARALRVGRIMPLPLTMRLYGGTDKFQHGYADHYQRHLKRRRWRRMAVIEIGVGGYSKAEPGGSLTIWRDYLPRSTILGVDLYPKVIALGTPCPLRPGRPSLRGRLGEGARPAHLFSRSRHRRRIAPRTRHVGCVSLPVPTPSPRWALRHRGSSYELLGAVRRRRTGAARQCRWTDQAARRRSADARRHLHPEAPLGPAARGRRIADQCRPRVSGHRVHREGPRSWRLSLRS